MFSRRISKTEFSDNSADKVFDNIINYANKLIYDESFISTLRVLLYKRIGDNSICLFNSIIYDQSTMLDNSINFIQPSDAEEMIICEAINNDSFVRLEKVEEFCKPYFTCKVFISEKKKSTVIVMSGNNYSLQNFHFIQSTIPIMLPWYFKDNELSESEWNLIKSLNKTNVDDYFNALSVISEEIGLRDLKIEKSLSGIANFERSYELTSIQENIASLNSQIENLHRSIRGLIHDKELYQIQEVGLKTMLNSEDNDSIMVDYFKSNKHLNIIDINVNNNIPMIHYMVTTHLEYFNQENVEKQINNFKSIFYRAGNLYDYIGNDAIKMSKLLKELFVSDEPRLKVRVCAGYTMTLGNGGNVASMDYESDCYESFSNYTPNPHIYNYSCLGGNVSAIYKCFENRNYIGAIEQTIVATKNINFLDAPVVERFMEQMWMSEGSNVKIELPDGRIVDPVEAVQWVEDNTEVEDNE